MINKKSLFILCFGIFGVVTQQLSGSEVQTNTQKEFFLSPAQTAFAATVAACLLENGYNFYRYGVAGQEVLAHELFDGDLSQLNYGVSKKRRSTSESGLHGYIKNFTSRLRASVKNPVESFKDQAMFNCLLWAAGLQGYLLCSQPASSKQVVLTGTGSSTAKVSSLYPTLDTSSLTTSWVLKASEPTMKKEEYDRLKAVEMVKEDFTEIKNKIILQERAQYQRKQKSQASGERTLFCFDGNPGVGKTMFVHNVADLLEYHCVTISCGNLGGNTDWFLWGVQEGYQGAGVPGFIVRSLTEMKQKKKKGLIVLLDELEKAESLAPFINLLDTSQNNRMKDKALSGTVDCSNIIFMATTNNTEQLQQKESGAITSRLTITKINDWTSEEKKAFIKERLKTMDQGFADQYTDQKIDALIASVEESGIRQVTKALTAAENDFLAEQDDE